MNARLKELINNADDGQADALTLDPRTLKSILQELEKMCNSSDTILCEPVAGGPGFKLSVKTDTSGSHPWKAIPTAGAKVNIAAGSVLSYFDTASYGLLKEFKRYAGGEVTVTGTGYIYGSIQWALGLAPIVTATVTDPDGDTTINVMRVTPDAAQDIGVVFAAALPTTTGYFYWEIAQVSLTATGAAQVDRQVLTHNPELWSISEPP